MRFLFINHNSDLYGASRSLLRLATRLARDQHDVHVLLPELGPLARALESNGVTCHLHNGLAIIDRAGMKSWRGRVTLVYRFLVDPFRLIRIIHRLQPDIIHTNVSVIVSSGPAARLSRKPHVMHVREFYDEFPAIWPAYRRYLLAFSNRIVCVSRAVAGQFPADPRVMVLHNGFPAAEFAREATAEAEAMRHSISPRPDLVLIGLPGRIKLRRKGQETFIQAAALLTEKFPQARFLIIGKPFDGNEHHQTQLEAEIERRGLRDIIRFTGECNDMIPVFRALDIVVLASGQAEPFGGTIIEAMAMNCPVVGTNIGGTPEQVEEGVSGFLVPPGDAAAMAVALEKLIHDPSLRQRMGRAGRARFEQRFEFEEFYRNVCTMYNELINRS